MRAVIYKRVSVLRNNVDGTSLDVQHERLEAYAKSQGWEIVDVYEDPGISAKDTNRPELQRMLRDAEAGKFDVILVYKLDRLSRSVSDFHQLMKKLDSNNVSLVSVTQHLDTSSPTGRLLRNILVDFANFERELITERVVDNKTHRAMEGKWNGGQPPFGYRLVNKRPEIVPDEAKQARKVYDLYLTGRYSMRKIARETGLPFSRVELILMNPFYAGKVAWGKTKYKDHKGMFRRLPQEEWIMADGDHEPIITFEEWEQAQKIKKKKKSIPDSRGENQLFKDLCYCGKCGNKLYFFNSSRGTSIYMYYRCHDINRFEGCRNLTVRQEELEKKVVRKMNDLLSDRDFWKQVDKNISRMKRDNKHEKELEFIQEQLKKTEKRIERLVKQMADGDIAHLIKPELMRLEKERKEWLQRKAGYEEKEEQLTFNPKLMNEVMGDLSSNWQSLTYEEKCEGIQLLIQSLTCDDEKVVIEWTDKSLPKSIFLLDKRAKNGRIIKTNF